ncbi:MAG: hypothetical protein ACP6IQ_05230 [Candidatus Njordarchaeia archaeon]
MPEEEKKDFAKLIKELELKLEEAKEKGLGNKKVVALPDIMKDEFLKKLIPLLPSKIRDAEVTIALNILKGLNKDRKKKVISVGDELIADIEWTNIPSDF